MQYRSAVLFACCLSFFATHSFAQKFPTKPITLVVPFAAGGNLDIVARTLAPTLEKILGQSVVVENKAGAGGTIGATFVARAEADGHTLLVTTPNAIVVLPHMSKTPYKLENFQTIGLAASTALILVAKTNGAIKDYPTLLANARANSGKVSIGHAGQGTTNHMAIMQLEDAAKIDLNVIPYKGSGPALVDLMGGQIDLMVDQLTSSTPHLKSGALKALAVLSRERDPAIPNVSTLRELGLAEFEATTATGILAPAGVPAATIETLNAALRKALADEAVRNKLVSIGSLPRPSSPQEFLQVLKTEDARAQKLAAAGKLKPD